MIETDLYTYLKSYAGLTALIGTNIFPLVKPQGILIPYILFQKVSNKRETTHGGFATLQKSRIQIDCFADRYITEGSTIGAKNIAEKVIEAIEAWPGASKIQAVLPENETDFYESETQIYHIPIDFFVWYGG
jgi:hypothetical protein